MRRAIDVDDAIAAETLAHREAIERQDRAFVAQLRAAILLGFESPAGVVGHRHGPCASVENKFFCAERLYQKPR
jgi:hypothetical protein